MKSALIGFTGFVGGNLKKQHKFDCYYNSLNFKKMASHKFNTVVCAGVSSIKWLANKEPEVDKKKIEELKKVLSSIEAKQFILISTVDVYPIFKDENESFDCHSIVNHSYGTHRLDFEAFCRDEFKKCIIVRLPGLFGEGIKKNVIYDLLNDNCLEMINSESSFQYYYLDNLWRDINKAIKADLSVINLFTEPLNTRFIIDNFFPEKKVGGNASQEIHYDLHTEYSHLWQREGHYISSKNEVLLQLKVFIENYSKRRLK